MRGLARLVLVAWPLFCGRERYCSAEKHVPTLDLGRWMGLGTCLACLLAFPPLPSFTEDKKSFSFFCCAQCVFSALSGWVLGGE